MAFRNKHWKVCGLIIENNQNDMRNFLKKSKVWKGFHNERFDIENLRSLVNALFEIGKLPLCEMIIEGIMDFHLPTTRSSLSYNVKTLRYLLNEQLA